MYRKKIEIKLDSFELNLLINGMNEFRNMTLAEDLPTEDVDELLLSSLMCMKNKEDRTIENKIKISYRQVGDFKIPNIILPPEQANITLGKWGERVPVALKQANRTRRQARHDA